MRSPNLLFAVFLIPMLLAACESTGSGNGGGGSPSSNGGEPELPDDVRPVVGERVRVEWKNLNPRRKDPALGLINRSSPELPDLVRQAAANAHIKPVDDSSMAVIIEAFKQANYFDHAREGVTLESLSPGDAHGVVYLRQGDRHWSLVFRTGLGGTGLPEVYRDCKQIIIEFHRRTYWPRTTTTNQDPSRVFQVPQGRPRSR